jgi:hypothetical protein
VVTGKRIAEHTAEQRKRAVPNRTYGIVRWDGNRERVRRRDGGSQLQDRLRGLPKRATASAKKKTKCIQFLHLNAVAERTLSDRETTEPMLPTRPATQTPNHVKGSATALYATFTPFYLASFFLRNVLATQPHPPLYPTSPLPYLPSTLPPLYPTSPLPFTLNQVPFPLPQS